MMLSAGLAFPKKFIISRSNLKMELTAQELQFWSIRILNIGKTSNSYLPSEIYGLEDTIVMDNAADLNEVKRVDNQQNAHLIGQPMENHLISEIKDFAKIINDPNKDLNRQLRKQWLQLAIQVNRVLYELRLSAGIRFDADELK